MSYDVIVIGAGHNGLTTASLLARRGRRVLVLEKRDRVGGLAAGEELHPGYRSDGVLHDGGRVRPWIVEELGLSRHGLSFRSETPPIFLPQKDDDGILLDRDPDKAQEEIARRSDEDARRYRDFRAFLRRVAPVFRRVIEKPPADVIDTSFGDFLRLGRAALALRLLGKNDMMEVLRIAPMCLADWLNEYFETDLLKAGLAVPGLEGCWAGPWSPGTTTNLLWMESTVGDLVEGGPAALVAALENAARSSGVEIRCDATVTDLIPGDGKLAVRFGDGEELEAGIVAASCDPRHLFLDLVPSTHLSANLERNTGLIRSRGITAKVHLALSGYPELAGRPGLRAEHIRTTGGSLDELERSFDPVKYRQMSRRPSLEIRVPTLSTPDLAPDGHHVFSIQAHGVPYDLEDGWNDAAKETLYRTVVETLAEVAPGVEDLIVGHQVLSPADLETEYGVSGGHLFHGEHATDQLVVRPAPECTGYRSPFPGLFLCGSGSHPGGGLTCVPGALAARAVLNSG